jgi:hypothetical protein
LTNNIINKLVKKKKADDDDDDDDRGGYGKPLSDKYIEGGRSSLSGCEER